MRNVVAVLTKPRSTTRWLLTSAWGVSFAFWLLLGLGFLSWTIRTDKPHSPEVSTRPVASPNPTPIGSLQTDEHGVRSGASTKLDDPDESSAQTNETVTAETDWRRTRHGWLRLSQATAIEPAPQNFVQRMSPLFWAAWLWLVTTWILVWSS